MNDPKDFVFGIPFLGLIWLVMFIVGFLIPALKRARRTQDETEKTISRMSSILEKIFMEISVLHHRVRDQKEGPMGPPGPPGPAGPPVHDLFDRVIALENALSRQRETQDGDFELSNRLAQRVEALEQKLEKAEAEAALDMGPEDLDERAEEAPVAFEIYRADLLRMGFGEVTIEDHVRAWSGRKVLPRPGRGVSA